MAACYEGNSDSDASSDDVSLPCFSKPGLFHKQHQTKVPFFPSPVVTPESKIKPQRQIGIVSKSLHRIPEATSPSSFDDLITGDTPPAPKRKGRKAYQDDGFEKCTSGVVTSHDIMRHSGGLSNIVERGKKVLHDIMKPSGIKNKNVGDPSFTSLRHLPIDKRRVENSLKKDIVTEFSKPLSSEESDWDADPFPIKNKGKLMSMEDSQIAFLPTDLESEDGSPIDKYKDEFSQKRLSSFQEQLQARQQRHPIEFRRELETLTPIDLSSEDEDMDSRGFKSRLTSTILGRKKDTWVSNSEARSGSQQKMIVRKSKFAGGSSQSGKTQRSEGREGNVPSNVGEEDNSDSKSDEDLPPQKYARVSNTALVKVKLEKDDINTTRRKYCCKKICLRKLGKKGIREARENYFRLNSQDRPLSLQWLVRQSDTRIDQDGLEANLGRTTYKIQGQIVCREGFKAVFCVGNHMLTRLNKLKNQNLEYPKSVGKAITDATYVVVSWMKNFFETHCESLPNKEVVHLPDNYSKLEVYNLYKSTFVKMDSTVNISYRNWCKLWKKHFPLVKIPAVNRFSVCADCEEFKSIREKAITTEDKSKLTIISFCMFFLKCKCNLNVVMIS